jgi:hypothetical protein
MLAHYNEQQRAMCAREIDGIVMTRTKMYRTTKTGRRVQDCARTVLALKPVSPPLTDGSSLLSEVHLKSLNRDVRRSPLLLIINPGHCQALL